MGLIVVILLPSLAMIVGFELARLLDVQLGNRSMNQKFTKLHNPVCSNHRLGHSLTVEFQPNYDTMYTRLKNNLSLKTTLLIST